MDHGWNNLYPQAFVVAKRGRKTKGPSQDKCGGARAKQLRDMGVKETCWGGGENGTREHTAEMGLIRGQRELTATNQFARRGGHTTKATPPPQNPKTPDE